jgi:hypothetical protein
MHQVYGESSAPRVPVTLVMAISVYGAWVVATYLLEGRLLTLLRPEAVHARVVYAVVANLIFGVVISAIILSRSIRMGWTDVWQIGLRSCRHTTASVTCASILGISAFLLQQPPTGHFIVALNGFAQVWVVSVAEILVCWSLLGVAVESSLKSATFRAARTGVAWVVAAFAFGVYHFAHSPPFNSARMVGFLVVVGLVTGAYYFLVRELYGTIVFHNFLALTGVVQALAESNRLDQFEQLQLPLILMAIVTTGLLVGVNLLLVRRSARA